MEILLYINFLNMCFWSEIVGPQLETKMFSWLPRCLEKWFCTFSNSPALQNKRMAMFFYSSIRIGGLIEKSVA